ncbi:MAG: hypothetical protein ACKO3V_12710, partial [Pirellula sp.]
RVKRTGKLVASIDPLEADFVLPRAIRIYWGSRGKGPGRIGNNEVLANSLYRIEKGGFCKESPCNAVDLPQG